MLIVKTAAGRENLKGLVHEADTVLIGAGAGLSASAGLVYSGERFERNFADFESKYGFHDMYSGGFYPYDTLEEYWAYWSRHIWVNRYTDPPKPVYEALLRLLEGKEYFVLTTNVDHCFQKAALRKSACSTPREITACGNAPKPAMIGPMTMKKPFAGCCWNRRRCGFPQS